MRANVGYALILMFLVMSGVALGQKIEIEHLVGPNLGSLRGNEVLRDFHSSKIDVTTGIGMNYYFRGKVSMGLKIIYEGKGSKGEISPLYDDGTIADPSIGMFRFRTNFKCMSMPVTARYSIGKKVKVSGEFGVFTSYIIKAVTISEDYDRRVYFLLDLSDNINKWDVGATFGIGVSVPITDKIAIKSTLFNNLGLLNVSNFPVTRDSTIKTNTLSLLLGMGYHLK